MRFVDFVEKRGKRSRSVAMLIAGCRRKLCHGKTLIRQQKKRIVAEACGAARHGQDLAFDQAVRNDEDLTVAGEGKSTAVTRTAAGLWRAGERVQQAKIVAPVRWERAAGLVIVVIGKTGAANAWGALKRVDLQAGVVGQNEKVRLGERVGDGFKAGIALEGVGRLFGNGKSIEAGKQSEGAIRGERVSEVAEFSRIRGGEIKVHVLRVVLRPA